MCASTACGASGYLHLPYARPRYLAQMTKQPRRLWFGEWQRRDDQPDQGDTFELLPDDDQEAPPPAENRRDVQRRAAGLAALGALVVLGFAISSGTHDSRLTITPPQSPPAQFPQT